MATPGPMAPAYPQQALSRSPDFSWRSRLTLPSGNPSEVEIGFQTERSLPDELARFRRWFAAFNAGHANHAEELDSTATKLGRFAGRAFAELRKRAKDSRS